MKKDNLKQFRDKRVKKNTALIKRAIEHIMKFDGVITMSTVAKVTREIVNSDDGEKGLTLSAISKNEHYRLLIQEAEQKTPIDKSMQVNPLSIGDARLQLHGLRVENLKMKDEIKVLRHKLKTIHLNNTQDNSQRIVIDENENIASSSIQNLINVLLEEEIAYLDAETMDLKLATFNSLLLNGKLVKKFIGELK